MPDDSWENATTGLYGVTRPDRPYRRYLWVVLILALTALVPTVGVPLLLPDDIGGRDPGPTAGGGPLRPTTAAPTDRTPGVAVVLTAPPSTAGAAPGDGLGSAGDRPPATGVGALAPAATAPVTLPLAIEAEAVRLRRAVVEAVDGASGGHAVRFTATNGEVRVDSLPVATGVYRVTVTYAPGGAWSGNLRGSDGPAPVSFVAGSGCCATLAAQLPLTAGGSLHIGLSNGAGGGAYPSIDLIVIEPV